MFEIVMAKYPDEVKTTTLYRIHFLDHNIFAFILLHTYTKDLLECILRKAGYNYEFVVLYNYSLTNTDENVSSNFENLFPKEKYNSTVLKNTVDYFNDIYIFNDEYCGDNSFSMTYTKFLDYYSILYDIQLKTDEIKLKTDEIKYNRSFTRFTRPSKNTNPPTVSKNTNSLTVSKNTDPTILNSNDLIDDSNDLIDDSNDLIDYSNNIIEDTVYYIFYCNTFKFTVALCNENTYYPMNITNEDDLSTSFSSSIETEFIKKYNTYYPMIITNERDLSTSFSSSIEIEFIKKYSVNESNKPEFETLFNNTCVMSRDIVVKMCEYYDTCVPFNFSDVNIKNVRDYIYKMYIIDDDKKNKMKSSYLIDSIAANLTRNSTIITQTIDIGVRNKISKLLVELGLHKFRLADGYYFYGIKHKKVTNVNLEYLVNTNNTQ